jgi:hypothetical protein
VPVTGADGGAEDDGGTVAGADGPREEGTFVDEPEVESLEGRSAACGPSGATGAVQATSGAITRAATHSVRRGRRRPSPTTLRQ